MSAVPVDSPVEGLWAVFRHSTNPMLLADDRRVYVDANEAASQLLGIPRESIIGMRIDDLTPSGNHDAMEDVWRAFLAAGSLAGVFVLALLGRRFRPVDATVGFGVSMVAVLAAKASGVFSFMLYGTIGTGTCLLAALLSSGFRRPGGGAQPPSPAAEPAEAGEFR